MKKEPCANRLRLAAVILAVVAAGFAMWIVYWASSRERNKGEPTTGLGVGSRSAPARQAPEPRQLSPATESTAETATEEAIGSGSQPRPPSGEERKKLMAAWQKAFVGGVSDYQEKEDEVWLRVPRYETVRDDYRKKAEDALGAGGPPDAKGAIALAQKELDAFWTGGSLISDSSYQHAYLSRAILELALEKDPDNFDLLRKSVDAIASAMPTKVRGQQCDASFNSVKPLVDKERDLIISGKVPASPEAALAMMDCAWVTASTQKPQDAVPIYEWLLKNYGACGWDPSMKELIQLGIHYSEAGKKWQTGMWLGRPTGESALVTLAQNVRRFQQCEGSPYWRSVAVKVWKVNNTGSISTDGD